MVYINSKTALAILAFCSSAFAVPFEAKRSSGTPIPLTRHITLNATNTNADRLRRKSLEARTGGTANAPAINNVQIYIMNIQIGNQTFKMLVDTGSSNTWVGNLQTFTPDPDVNAVDTGDSFAVTYGSGSVSGEEFTGTMIVGGLFLDFQSFGVTSLGFTENIPAFIDGFVGFGPDGLTDGTVENQGVIETVMSNLKSQGEIGSNVLGVFFHAEPGSNSGDTNGELTLGGVDSSHFSGSILWAPITTASLYNQFFALDISSITFGSTTVMSVSHPALLDTGTTFPVLPGAVFDAMIAAAGGGGVDTNFPSIFGAFAFFDNIPTENINFKFNGHTISLTPAQYIVPPDQAQNDLGLDSDHIWTYLQRGADDVDGSPSLNFVIGQKILEFVYSAYDTDNQRVGLAPNAF